MLGPPAPRAEKKGKKKKAPEDLEGVIYSKKNPNEIEAMK